MTAAITEWITQQPNVILPDITLNQASLLNKVINTNPIAMLLY